MRILVPCLLALMWFPSVARSECESLGDSPLEEVHAMELRLGGGARHAVKPRSANGAAYLAVDNRAWLVEMRALEFSYGIDRLIGALNCRSPVRLHVEGMFFSVTPRSLHSSELESNIGLSLEGLRRVSIGGRIFVSLLGANNPAYAGYGYRVGGRVLLLRSSAGALTLHAAYVTGSSTQLMERVKDESVTVDSDGNVDGYTLHDFQKLARYDRTGVRADLRLQMPGSLPVYLGLAMERTSFRFKSASDPTLTFQEGAGRDFVDWAAVAFAGVSLP
jgi:hypothetical protein